MGFYRLATQRDITNQLNRDKTPWEVKDLLQQGKFKEALFAYRDRTGVSLNDARDACVKVTVLIRAQEDMRKGLPVYTEYSDMDVQFPLDNSVE